MAGSKIIKWANNLAVYSPYEEGIIPSGNDCSPCWFADWYDCPEGATLDGCSVFWVELPNDERIKECKEKFPHGAHVELTIRAKQEGE